MRTTQWLLMLTLFGIAMPPLYAQAASDLAEIFAKADANHDGRISRDEFQTARAARFDKLDRNRDGYLDDGDIPRLLRANAQRMQKFDAALNMADANHDGRVSRAEYMTAGLHMFELVDANHDGYVDHDELQQAQQRLSARVMH